MSTSGTWRATYRRCWMSKSGLPDFEERARLQKVIADAKKYKTKVRRIKHSCGHEQGHRIDDGYLARDEYIQFARQACGACGGNDILVDDDEDGLDDEG